MFFGLLRPLDQKFVSFKSLIFFGNFRHPGRKKFMIEILGNTKISRFKVFLTTEVDHKTNFFKGGSVREKVRLKI